MKTIISILFILTIWNSCVNITHRTGEDFRESSFYPFIITEVDAKIIDVKYKIIGYSRGIPARPIKKIDKYVYLIGFTLLVKEEVVWDKPFLINIQFHDNTSDTILFNDEELELTNLELHEYLFTVEVIFKQDVKITLGYFDDNGDEIFGFDNPFQYKIVELD